MLVRADQPLAAEPLVPICDEAEVCEFLDGLVADEAPRLFAVVQEYGEQIDYRIAAWGMAFEDHAELVAVGGGTALSLSTADRARHLFRRGSQIRARIVWVDPDAATPADDDAC